MPGLVLGAAAKAYEPRTRAASAAGKERRSGQGARWGRPPPNRAAQRQSYHPWTTSTPSQLPCGSKGRTVPKFYLLASLIARLAVVQGLRPRRGVRRGRARGKHRKPENPKTAGAGEGAAESPKPHYRRAYRQCGSGAVVGKRKKASGLVCGRVLMWLHLLRPGYCRNYNSSCCTECPLV
jgi:hypothetical protein